MVLSWVRLPQGVAPWPSLVSQNGLLRGDFGTFVKNSGLVGEGYSKGLRLSVAFLKNVMSSPACLPCAAVAFLLQADPLGLELCRCRFTHLLPLSLSRCVSLLLFLFIFI